MLFIYLIYFTVIPSISRMLSLVHVSSIINHHHDTTFRFVYFFVYNSTRFLFSALSPFASLKFGVARSGLQMNYYSKAHRQ